MLDGSKGCAEGVARALRFWVMESSRAERERRRKSEEREKEWLGWGSPLRVGEELADLVALVH